MKRSRVLVYLLCDRTSSLTEQLKIISFVYLQVTVNIGEQFDWEILQNVHKTAHRSKKLASDLHGLKTKVYEMERELRNF